MVGLLDCLEFHAHLLMQVSYSYIVRKKEKKERKNIHHKVSKKETKNRHL